MPKHLVHEKYKFYVFLQHEKGIFFKHILRTNTFGLLRHVLKTNWAGADPEFPVGGAANIQICQIFPKTAWN